MHTPRTGRRLARILPLTLAGLAVLAATAHAAPDPAEQIPNTEIPAQNTGPEQSTVDKRLAELRAGIAHVAKLVPPLTQAYRIHTTGGPSLILTPRPEPYGVADLLTLIPDSFVRQADDTYLLSENLVILQGAHLRLTGPGDVQIRLLSTPAATVSVLNLGGFVDVDGGDDGRVLLTSWDPLLGTVDVEPADGRAYLLSINGRFAMKGATAQHLGFDTGRTSGVAVTGKLRSITGFGPDLLVSEAPVSPQRMSAPPEGSIISVDIRDSSFIGNSTGLFIRRVHAVLLADVEASHNFHDGITLRRVTAGALITKTSAQANGRHGFLVSRSRDVTLIAARAESNGKDGFRFSDGGPEPAALGEPVTAQGNISLLNGNAEGNGRQGIGIADGQQYFVSRNTVRGGTFGIVVRGNVSQVEITKNHVSGAEIQGIAIRDGVDTAAINDNVVTATETGIYLRASRATIARNRIADVQFHGVSLSGQVGGSEVVGNLVSDSGASAVDARRAIGPVVLAGNRTGPWRQVGLAVVRARVSPSAVGWFVVVGLLLLSGWARRAGPPRR